MNARGVSHAAAAGVMFVGFGLGALALSWVALPLVRRRFGDEGERVRACQSLLAASFRVFHAAMRLLGLVHIDARELLALRAEGPQVLIANHPTLIDTTVILAALPHACVVARGDLFRGALFGRLLRYCGHIEAGDGSPMSGAAVLQSAAERLGAGFSVLIFPEGTRSPPGGLRRFHAGAFEVARRAGVALRPLVITCDPPTLAKGVAWHALPRDVARLRVSVEPPVVPRAASRNLAKQVEFVYQSRLGLLGRREGATGKDSTDTFTANAHEAETV